VKTDAFRTPSYYRTLDEAKIIETLTTLRNRIDKQFPDSGLGRVAGELIAVGGEVAESADYLEAPNWPIRILAGSMILAMIVVLFLAGPRIELPAGAHKFSDVQSISAALNIVAIVGVAAVFLLRLETVLKRRRAHAVIHELRSLAHVIDMHQISKDPARLFSLDPESNAEPQSEAEPRRIMSQRSLGRYLDFCTDLLSVTGKLSALLVQRFKDEVVMGEVTEIEALTTGLAGRIWQKIQLLDDPPGEEGR
jgi:hypothetical protein